MNTQINKQNLIGFIVAPVLLIILVLIIAGSENGKYQMIAEPSGARVLILNTRNAELTMCHMPHARISPNFAGSECRTESIPTLRNVEK